MWLLEALSRLWQRALSIQLKIREILVRNQMERTISVQSDRNIWDYLEGRPLWPILTGLVISVVWTECLFPFDKIVVPSASLFRCILLTRTITKRAVAWVRSL